MTKQNETPVTPESEPAPSAESDNPEAKPINPKETAYQRSKEDLARKRRQLHRKGGRR